MLCETHLKFVAPFTPSLIFGYSSEFCANNTNFPLSLDMITHLLPHGLFLLYLYLFEGSFLHRKKTSSEQPPPTEGQ